MEYKKLSKEKGEIYLPKIWNVFFTKEDDLWISPFIKPEIRYRTMFKEENGELTAYFHLTKKELEENVDLSSKSGTIYMYGTYNQIQVCQMKSYGKIREMVEEEKNEFVKIIKGRFNGEKKIDPDHQYCPNSKSLDNEEKRAGLKAINSEGKFFRFDPITYGYNVYERG
jgi:hypothetical protein